ncbi:MAG TPA: recombinase family protein [Candidatus Paceibacterota bacterium]|nr:recombinase family protein [Candidatus Paceibacterota bacterium]
MHRYFIYCRKSTENEDHQAISLESQYRELMRFAEEHALPVVEVLSESKSARTPGRQVFAELLRRIARGEANGIIAWHPDRLTRNAVDGGQIIHYLDTGKLVDLRFPTFTFENSPQGKFMLMIMFGHSKYGVDTLSEHVKRGNRTKRELGWFPGRAPIGYLNTRSDLGTKIITRDPERFPIMKKVWELFLTGKYSGTELLALASRQFGLRTRRTWRTGGTLLSKPALYRVLRNPFYTGHIIFKENWHPANHEPMVSVADFNKAQRLLRGTRLRPRRYRFAYSGLIRCGNCSASITAEQKTNRYGTTYIYYRCTHSRPAVHCREGAIEERELERQIIVFFADQGRETTLLHREGIRYLLASRAQSVTLQAKRIRIELKQPN